MRVLRGRSWRGSWQAGPPAVPGDGGDSPAWSRKRDGYRPPEGLTARRSSDDGVGERRRPYAELHTHSYFSFLDGVSSPEALVEEAARLQLDAITLTDHDGMYGAVRFAVAARELGIRAGYGAELSLGLSAPQTGGSGVERRVRQPGATAAAGPAPSSTGHDRAPPVSDAASSSGSRGFSQSSARAPSACASPARPAYR